MMSRPTRPARTVLGVRSTNVSVTSRTEKAGLLPLPTKQTALQSRRLAVPSRGTTGLLQTKAQQREQKASAFQIYTDENACSDSSSGSGDDKYNVVKQLDRLGCAPKQKREPLAPLAVQHEARRPAKASVSDEAEVKRPRPGSSSMDEDDDEPSVYGSVMEGSSASVDASDYHSALPGEDALPSVASEYTPDMRDIRDMFVYMRNRELQFRPRRDFLLKQRDLTEAMRLVLIDWLNDVIIEFKMETETLHFAVSMIDRLLSLMEVSRTYLQLVGTAALMIAAKYEMIYPPELKDFVYVTDDTYTESQILKMERKVLQHLAFDVSVPTSLWFVDHLCQIARVPQQSVHLAHYLVDLTLLDYKASVEFLPSLLGAAAFCLANMMTGPAPWPLPMEKATGISVAEMRPALEHLLGLFQQAPQAENKSVYERYSQPSFDSVATLSCPAAIPPM